ncbi:thermonuclease family protein [Terrarubrum flagellatum]|uniref:thermonuclease family protein n=1 Tax=Terrirubrum flagellatum TaxID=2895980 RepID=UPI00314544DA
MAGVVLAGFGAAAIVGRAEFTRSAGATPAAIEVEERDNWSAPNGRSRRLIGDYEAVITRVIDGDTVEARVAVWLGQDVITRIRLLSVDAPEIRGACGSERDLAVAARNRVHELVAGRRIIVRQVGGDKYFGRVTANLMADGVNVANALLAEGLARPYGGGRRGSWCGLSQR